MNNIRVLLVLYICSSVACGISPDLQNTSMQPTSWLKRLDGSGSMCEGFRYEYSNRGEMFAAEPAGDAQAFLSEIMFGRLEGGELPESVKLSADSSENMLRVTLIGNSTRELEYEVSCVEGWFVLSKARSNNYLGEGVTESQFRQVSNFRVDMDAQLIIHTLVSAQFTSVLERDSTKHSENWYRFQSL